MFRPKRECAPIERIRSSTLMSSERNLKLLAAREAEAAQSQTSTPTKAASGHGEHTEEGCWKQGQLVWAVRSFSAFSPLRMAAGPWPAVVISQGKGSHVLMVRWLGEDSNEVLGVAEDQVKVFYCPEHAANMKRSRSAAFTAAISEANNLAISQGCIGMGSAAFGTKRKTLPGAKEEPKSQEKENKSASLKRKRLAIKEEEIANQIKDENAEACADDTEELSAYEKMRQANINRNQVILDMLELPSMPAEVARVTVRVRGLKSTKKNQADLLPARERSLRVQGKAPDGELLELPANWNEPVRFNPSAKKESGGKCSSSVNDDGGDKHRRRTGEISVADCVAQDACAEDPAAALASARARTDLLVRRMLECDVKDSSRGRKDRKDKWARRPVTLEALKSLQVAESDVAKVCPSRITSIAFHPMEDHVIIAAGDKRGNIGIFTPDWSSDDSCVSVLDVHSSSATWMAFDKFNPHSLYSSSYENIVRRLDVERQVFAEVLQLEEDEYKFLSTCHLDSQAKVVRVGFGTGHLQVLDLRGGCASTVHLHDKTIRSIDVSPLDPNLVLTASIDHHARIWDIRKLQRSSSIATIEHSQGVTQARFGQGAEGNVIITTSYDDTLKVFDVDKRRLRHTIRHDNTTGRWLSSFQAVFVPGSDQFCSIGSMETLRGIDVIDVFKGSRVARLTCEPYASITSVNAWHPTRSLLVGGNSSGKVFLWR